MFNSKSEWMAERLLGGVSSVVYAGGELILIFEKSKVYLIEDSYRHLIITLDFEAINDADGFLKSEFGEKIAECIDEEEREISFRLIEMAYEVAQDQVTFVLPEGLRLKVGESLTLQFKSKDGLNKKKRMPIF